MNVKLTLMKEIKKTEKETVDQSQAVPGHFTIQIINVWIPVICVIRVLCLSSDKKIIHIVFVHVPD